MRLALLRSLVVVLLSICGLAPALAQEQPIQRTIRSQIDAFRADDFGTAFTFASPAIQALFGTPETFGQMVRNGYPMVHRPSGVRMGALRQEDGLLWQRVFVTDAEGRGHVLDYQMVETPEGWKINGVYLVPGDGAGA